MEITTMGTAETNAKAHDIAVSMVAENPKASSRAISNRIADVLGVKVIMVRKGT